MRISEWAGMALGAITLGALGVAAAYRRRHGRSVIINLTGDPVQPDSAEFATEADIYDVRLDVPLATLSGLFRAHGWRIHTGRTHEGLSYPDEWDVVAYLCDLAEEAREIEGPLSLSKRARFLVIKDEDEPDMEAYLYLGSVQRAGDPAGGGLTSEDIPQ